LTDSFAVKLYVVFLCYLHFKLVDSVNIRCFGYIPSFFIVMLSRCHSLVCEHVFCAARSFHWVLSAGGQAQLEDGLESPHLLGKF